MKMEENPRCAVGVVIEEPSMCNVMSKFSLYLKQGMASDFTFRNFNQMWTLDFICLSQILRSVYVNKKVSVSVNFDLGMSNVMA